MSTLLERGAVEPIDLETAADEDVRKIAELQARLAAERVPEDPPIPIDVFIARLRAKMPSAERHAWVARSGEAVAGFAGMYRDPEGQNAHAFEMDMSVHPDHRRRGIARTFLTRIVETASRVDGALLIAFTNDRIAAARAFAERAGFKAGLEMHTNQLVLGEVDPDLVRRWRALADSDAAGYRLEWVPSPVPDDRMEAFCTAIDVMNTAPRGDLQVADERTTPKQVREREEWARAAGVEPWTLIAFHKETGEPAGFTMVGYNPRVAHVVQQWGTGVAPAHRGHGLGKLLKATMLARILEERPDAKFIRTGNADVNAPMLAINNALGFKRAWAQTIWQAKADDLRSYVS